MPGEELSETPASETVVAARPERLASKRPPTRSAAELWNWFKTAGLNFSDINGTVWSASFAYYAFFSLVPLMLLLVTLGTDVAARFVGEQAAKDRAFDYIVKNVDTFLPVSYAVQETIHGTVRGVMDARGKLGLIAFVSLIWSGTGFFQSLVSAVNQAWGHHPLNWWKLPLKSLLMLGVLLSALLLGVVVPAILKIVQKYVSFGGIWTEAIFAVLAVLIPVAVLFYGFLLFYKLAPRRRANVTFSMVWIPALVVTALLQVCQGLFVFYSTHITNFNVIYGAFGGVIALMLWAYLSGLVIVFGGCLCAAQRRVTPIQGGPASLPAPLADGPGGT